MSETQQIIVLDPASLPPISVFSDNDGVKADFEKSFRVRFGKDFDAYHIGVAWKMINSVPDFYATLPLMPDVDVYWKEVRKYRPDILTGCHTTNYDSHEAGKRIWHEANHYFPDGTVFLRDTNMIICRTRDKPLHMRNPGDILIDDHTKNGVKWTAAGGRFIHFRHARQAATELRELVAELKQQGYRFNDE
jgi:hypothetical protein